VPTSVPVLEAEELVVRYGAGEPAVRGLTLSLAPGTITCVVGANGAGKTSTARAISGLLPVASGRVRLLGEDVTNRPVHRIVHGGLAHVPEGRQVFPHLTVRENLTLGAYRLGRVAKADMDFERVFGVFPELETRGSAQAGNLSGGQQQMLSIGRGLMGRPACLIIDEPTMGLAPIVVQRLGEALKAVRDENPELAILILDQRAVLAQLVALELHILRRGELVGVASTQDLDESDLRSSYFGQT
jgi:branched-chain amino acid transport system ATP-binding protein